MITECSCKTSKIFIGLEFERCVELIRGAKGDINWTSVHSHENTSHGRRVKDLTMKWYLRIKLSGRQKQFDNIPIQNLTTFWVKFYFKNIKTNISNH